MVVVPFASLLSKSGILFLSLSVTALPSLPSKLALKTSLFEQHFQSPITAFIAAQFSVSPCLHISLYPPPAFSAACVCVCARAGVRVHFIGIVCVRTSVCVRARARSLACDFVCVCFCHVLYEDVNFRMFCTLVYY